jgi:hypothetical protein
MDASIRKWWSGATPTTDCEAQWTLHFKLVLQKYEKRCYETSHDDPLFTNILVARFIEEQTFFQKKMCESVDERYL